MIAIARPFDPHEASDLRRKRSRDLIESVASRAMWLGRGERTLVLAVYRDGLSAAAVARIRRTKARTVRRQVRLAVQRLFGGEAEFVMRHRETWAATRRNAATLVLVQGKSMREASRTLGVALHAVRLHVEAVRSLARGEAGDVA